MTSIDQAMKDDDRYYVVVIVEEPARRRWRRRSPQQMAVMTRRLDGPDGPLSGPWGMLTQAEADALAKTWNDTVGAGEETGTATPVECYRFDRDPLWPEEHA